MARKRRRRKGVGQTITVRRMRGLGKLNNPRSFMGAAAPPLLGGGLTAGTVVAARYFAKPSEGETPMAIYKWAPLIGIGAGGIGSLGLYYLAGAPAAVSSFATSVLVGLSHLIHDMLVKDSLGEFQLAHPPAAMTNGNGGGGGEGMGVVVPQRLMGAGTQGIVMGPAAERNPLNRYGLGATGYGEEVSLGSVNPRAFGTPGFGA